MTLCVWPFYLRGSLLTPFKAPFWLILKELYIYFYLMFRDIYFIIMLIESYVSDQNPKLYLWGVFRAFYGFSSPKDYAYLIWQNRYKILKLKIF